MNSWLKKYSLDILPALLFLLLAISITYPLIFHLGTLTTGKGDELLLAWIQQWVIHSLQSNPLHLFEAPIFYPYPHSLAYSDILLTSSVFASWIKLIIKEPIALHNVTLINAIFLLGLSVYLLANYCIKDRLFSIFAGTLVVLSPVVLDKYIHLQILYIFFVPLSFLCFFHFLKVRQTKFLLLSMICFILQTLNSFMPGYFILFGLTTIFIYYWITKRVVLRQYLSFSNVFVVVISFFIILPFTIPYYQVSNLFHYTRDIRDTIHFALQPEDLYYAHSFTRLSPVLESIANRSNYPDSVSFKNGYPGLTFLVLFIITIIFLCSRWKKQSSEVKAIFLIGIVGLLLSLGPALHFGRQTIHNPFPIPLPYAIFYYIIPGFNGLRSSARWEMLAIISFAVAITILLHKLLENVSYKKRTMVIGLLLLSVFIEHKPSFTFTALPTVDKFPKEYQWLATREKDAVIIEMPIYNWNNFPYAIDELQRQYYSTLHFRQIVNGGSGFSPPPWQEMVFNLLSTFPDPRSLKQLKDIGVDYIVIHQDDYDRMYKDKYRVNGRLIQSGQQIVNKLGDVQEVQKMFQTDSVSIYHLL